MRSGIDAYLDYGGDKIPFELKTTSKGSVTTVRDFGPDHIRKWKGKHWLIGFLLKYETYYKYVSPSQMAPWILEKENYIKPDFQLAELSYNKVGIDDLFEILGRKLEYSLGDAQRIQKKQLTKQDYIDLQDRSGGYSPEAMLQILKQRAKYLMERGSTLNNPHIPFSYFEGMPEISENFPETLRQYVQEYFNER